MDYDHAKVDRRVSSAVGILLFDRPRQIVHRRAGQRGQALAETLVASLVLVPMFILIVLLGKYQSVQQATIAASRTLAFECTVRIDACDNFSAHEEMIDEIRHRHFGQASFALHTDARLVDANAAQQRNPLWVDRRNQSLLERFDDVGGRVSTSSFDAGLSVAVGRAAGAASAAVEALSGLAGPGHFGLEISSGLFEARVQANLSAQSGRSDFLTRLDPIAIRPQARAAILVDAWNASGPYGSDEHSVDSRVRRGGSLGSAVETGFELAYLPMIGFTLVMQASQLESNADRFEFHRVDVDLVPEDRIGQ